MHVGPGRAVAGIPGDCTVSLASLFENQVIITAADSMRLRYDALETRIGDAEVRLWTSLCTVRTAGALFKQSV
jgi:hypothetical protein